MIKLINDDAFRVAIPPVDMIFTDPPFELAGADIARLLSRVDYQHLVLICTMRQALDFYKSADLDFCFDLVVSHISPKKAKSYHYPNMTHSNILYFKRHGVKSAFDRRRVERHDQFGAAGYYPSIFHAPKVDRVYKYQKNQEMLNDVLGAFDVESVCDPFAGSGSTAIAMLESGIKTGVMIERDKSAFELMQGQLSLLQNIE